MYYCQVAQPAQWRSSSSSGQRSTIDGPIDFQAAAFEHDSMGMMELFWGSAAVQTSPKLWSLDSARSCPFLLALHSWSMLGPRWWGTICAQVWIHLDPRSKTQLGVLWLLFLPSSIHFFAHLVFGYEFERRLVSPCFSVVDAVALHTIDLPTTPH